MMYKEAPTDFKEGWSVVACYVEHEGRFILLHRHPHKSNGDKWGLPAGKMETGETMHEAIIREVHEETGLVISEDKLTYLDSVFVRHEGRDFEYHMFKTSLENMPEITISPSEHSEFAWATPKEAMTMNLIQDQDECIKLFYEV